MTGIRAQVNSLVRQLGICICIAAVLSVSARSAHAVIVISDGFGDADRNNDGQVAFIDTDINQSLTFNEFTGDPPNATGADSGLANRGIIEVTAATDVTDVGIKWSGIRSYDTTANLVKSRLRIINDNVATGLENSADLHNDGLALSVESRGQGSSFIGNFGQSIALGAATDDKIVVSFDWRAWKESANPDSQPAASNAIRWGIYQDTDGQLGQSGPFGDGGASVVWGQDDGNFFASSPGAKGDKGINTEVRFGPAAPTTESRIRWEYNTTDANITDTSRILEGTGVTDTLPSPGDTATIATPATPANGPGGIITDLSSYAPHNLRMEIKRLADGLVEVAAFVDNFEYLRDSIKTTDTGYNTLQPVPFTYNYVAFRNSIGDWDYVIDNFKVETFSASVGVAGDYNNDGTVNAADYVVWRKGGTLANEVADPGTVSAADYTEWRARFGNPAGSGASLEGAAVPEPGTIFILLIAAFASMGCARRRFA